MTETAELRISVNSSQVRSATGDLRRLAGGAAKVIGPILSVAAAVTALSKAVEVQRQFDVLNAGLVTATGSTEGAAAAFQSLSKFAAKTPYDLNQAVEGFTKLVNLGLNPSEAAMVSYGNTASALGQDLNSMIEAVADAATGEFERLKAFGIKAKSEGNSVSLTFQGVTTKIGKNAAEIEEYLIGLGQVNFAGAMDQRLDTLDGKINNLADTWDQTYRIINEAGLGAVMKASVETGLSALEEFNAELESGRMGAHLAALADKFDGFGRDAVTSFEILRKAWNDTVSQDVVGGIGYAGGKTVDFLIEAFWSLPENIRAAIQILTVEVLSGFDRVSAYSTAFRDGLSAIFNDDTFEGVGARLEAQLEGLNGVRDSSIASILEERDAALGSYAKQSDAADDLRKTYDERRAAENADTTDRLAGFKLQVDGSKAVTGEEEKAAKAAAKNASTLASAYDSASSALSRQIALYGQTSEEAQTRYEVESGALKGIAAQQASYLIGLARELDAKDALTEQEKIRIDILRESGQLRAANDAQFELEYAAKIAEYEKQGNVEAAQRLQTLRAIREIQMNAAQAPGTVEGVSKAPDSQGADAMYGGASGEMMKLQEEAVALEAWRMTELEKQRAFLEAKAISEEEYAARIKNINDQHQQELGEVDAAKRQVQLAAGEEFFGNMAGLTAAFAGEQSSAYKAMFAMEKAYAIAKVLMNAPKTASDAYSAMAGIPYVGPALGVAAAVAALSFQAAQAAGISSIGMSFEGGGSTGNGPRTGGLDGKGGFMAMVHPKETIIDHTKSGSGGSGSSGLSVTVNMVEDASKAGTVEQTQNDDGSWNVQAFVSDIFSDGPASKAISRKFGVQGVGR